MQFASRFVSRFVRVEVSRDGGTWETYGLTDDRTQVRETVSDVKRYIPDARVRVRRAKLAK